MTSSQIHYVTGVIFDYNERKKRATVHDYLEYYHTVSKCINCMGIVDFIDHCLIVLPGIRFGRIKEEFPNYFK